MASAARKRVFGKLVKIQHGPATVSAEDRSYATVPRGMGRRADSDDAQVRRPARVIPAIPPEPMPSAERSAAQGCLIYETSTPLGVYARARGRSFSPLHGFRAEIKGTVIDPSQRPVSGAMVAAVNDVGIIVEQITDDRGQFRFQRLSSLRDLSASVTAPGFQTVTVAPAPRQHSACAGAADRIRSASWARRSTSRPASRAPASASLPAAKFANAMKRRRWT